MHVHVWCSWAVSCQGYTRSCTFQWLFITFNFERYTDCLRTTNSNFLSFKATGGGSEVKTIISWHFSGVAHGESTCPCSSFTNLPLYLCSRLRKLVSASKLHIMIRYRNIMTLANYVKMDRIFIAFSMIRRHRACLPHYFTFYWNIWITYSVVALFSIYWCFRISACSL